MEKQYFLSWSLNAFESLKEYLNYIREKGHRIEQVIPTKYDGDTVDGVIFNHAQKLTEVLIIVAEPKQEQTPHSFKSISDTTDRIKCTNCGFETHLGLLPTHVPCK